VAKIEAEAERVPLADQLRQIVKQSGKAELFLARGSGLSQPTLNRFMRGHCELSLTNCEVLCCYLGVNFTQPYKEFRPKPPEADHAAVLK
jgi:transcriptional regulator with XRE-family HTH domain